MRTITQEFKVFTFKEASKEVKEKIIEYFRNDSMLYEHNLSERLDTLKKLASVLHGDLDYSFSCVPDRGEFIKITPKYDELRFDDLWETINVNETCPLTGVCYDHDIIDNMSKYNMTVERLNEVLEMYIVSIHEEYESMLTEEHIGELCESNEYEFTENGELYFE